MATTANDTESTEVERLREYLRRRVAAGDTYFKSRYIAEDLDLTASEIGALPLKLSEQEAGPDVEQWSRSNGTTWRVTRT